MNKRKHKSVIEWIPVEDGLPPNYVKGNGVKYYLVKIQGWYPNFGNGILIDGEWYKDFSAKYTAKITHWADVE
jgi:hypothetical protein